MLVMEASVASLQDRCSLSVRPWATQVHCRMKDPLHTCCAPFAPCRSTTLLLQFWHQRILTTCLPPAMHHAGLGSSKWLCSHMSWKLEAYAISLQNQGPDTCRRMLKCSHLRSLFHAPLLPMPAGTTAPCAACRSTTLLVQSRHRSASTTHLPPAMHRVTCIMLHSEAHSDNQASPHRAKPEPYATTKRQIHAKIIYLCCLFHVLLPPLLPLLERHNPRACLLLLLKLLLHALRHGATACCGTVALVRQAGYALFSVAL